VKLRDGRYKLEKKFDTQFIRFALEQPVDSDMETTFKAYAKSQQFEKSESASNTKKRKFKKIETADEEETIDIESILEMQLEILPLAQDLQGTLSQMKIDQIALSLGANSSKSAKDQLAKDIAAIKLAMQLKGGVFGREKTFGVLSDSIDAFQKTKPMAKLIAVITTRVMLIERRLRGGTSSLADSEVKNSVDEMIRLLMPIVEVGLGVLKQRLLFLDEEIKRHV